MTDKLKRQIKQIKAHHYIFFLFLVLNAAVLYSVPLFGDDYYYASFIKKGLSFFVSENVVHYVKTNGRAIVHLLDQLLLYSALWKFFNLLSLGFAVYFTAKTVAIKNKNRFGHALIIICCLTGLLELAIVRQSIYWATGSMNYLFPYALFITFYYLLRRDVTNNTNARYLWILGFFTGFSTEQAGFAAIVAIIAIILIQFIKQKNLNHPHLYTNLVATGAGFALQIFAPGNAMRQTYYPEFYSKSIIGRIIENAKPIYKIIFSAEGIYIFILIALFCMVFAIIKKLNKKPLNTILLAFVCHVVIAAIILYIKAIVSNALMLTELNFLIFFSLALLAFTIYFIIRSIKQRDFDNLFFFILAPVLQLVMLLSPQYGPRTLLISAFCLFIPLSSMLLEHLQNPIFAVLTAVLVAIFIQNLIVVLFVAVILVIIVSVWHLIKKTSFKKVALTAIIIVLICFSFSHIAANICGYYENYNAHIANKTAVEQFKKNGGEQLTLFYLPNPNFKYTMPYDDPYHLYWFKVVNDLPEDTVIVFIPYD